MGRYSNTGNGVIAQNISGISGSPASPFTSRVLMHWGLSDQNFSVADLVGYNLKYGVIDNQIDTISLQVGTDPTQPEQILSGPSGIWSQVNGAIGNGYNPLFPITGTGLNILFGGTAPALSQGWTSYTISSNQPNVTFQFPYVYIAQGAGGYVQIPPQSLAVAARPGYNAVTYAYTASGDGTITQPAGQLHALWSGPSSAGPWTLLSAALPPAPYTYADFAARGPTWYQVASIDPSAGQSNQVKTSSAAVTPLPSIGGGRTIARDMLSIGLI